MSKIKIFTLAIIVLSFATGFYFYPKMPEVMASHWNLNNAVNGYLPKFWGLFLMPVISLVLYGFSLVIPKIDPLKDNIKKFSKYFEGFILLLFLFLFYIYCLTIAWNLGFHFLMGSALAPALAGLFYACGVLIENAQPNWSIGIRTPWTLSNETVWKKTHQVGGKAFKIAAIVSLAGLIFPSLAYLFVLIPILFASFYVILYSYLEFHRLQKHS